MPFVSVIVPAYNAEATIEKTLSDIIAQTYDDYELILIDDGSTDATPLLCDNAANRDGRLRVVHQVNQGLSQARNIGVELAHGEYITFIDSDDRVEPFYLEYLVKALRQERADIACGKVDRVTESYELTPQTPIFRTELFDSRSALREMLTGKKFGVGAWCRLVRREWQLANLFLENTYYEDLSNTYKTYLMADRVVYVDTVLYHYVMRGGSITGRKTTTLKQCEDYDAAIRLCREGVAAIYPDLEKDAIVCAARDYVSLYLSIHRCPQRDRLSRMEENVLSWMRSNWKTAVANPRAPVGVRLRLALFGISPRLYETLYYKGIRLKGKAIA